MCCVIEKNESAMMASDEVCDAFSLRAPGKVDGKVWHDQNKDHSVGNFEILSRNATFLLKVMSCC